MESPTFFKQYRNTIQRKIQEQLSRSAMGYLKSGLELFHSERKSSVMIIEPAIGNLAIAIELMLKAFVAKNDLLLLFKELPLELRILFTCPDIVPLKNFNWRQYDVDLYSFRYKTLQLDELISVFYVFFPDYRQALKPYFKLISSCRNASIHFLLPSFQRYELDRTAYLALLVYKYLDSSNTFGIGRYTLKEEDEQFMASFGEEQVERVRKEIERAKDIAKGIKEKHIGIAVDGWDDYVTKCPVCGCDGILTGFTDIEADVQDDGSPEPYLIFLADSFACEGCSLSLNDVEELKLAGMDICYDRPDKDVNDWFSATEPPDFRDFEAYDYS